MNDGAAMFGIIGEDDSDFATLKVLVKRLAGLSMTIKGGGYDGCAELLRKGATAIRAMWNTGEVRRFIVCHDADGCDPDDIAEKVRLKIVKPSGLAEHCCIVVPVQELEAWILADLDAIRHVIATFPRCGPIQNPERIPDPKEHLERLSENERRKRLYEHARHNEKVAWHLELDLVRSKCPSYLRFEAFVLTPS